MLFEIKTHLELDPNGFYKISDEEYFARPELSNSDLNAFAKSPKYYKYYKSAPKKDPTPNMLLGSLVHCMVLEPGEVHKRYARSKKVDKRTSEGKLIAKIFEEENKGLTLINEEIFQQAQDIVGSLLKNEIIDLENILSNAHAELAIFWERDGVRCRGKLDLLQSDGFIYDLKTTSNLNDFEKSIANYHYHRQAALYQCGASTLLDKEIGFKFIVVETVEPHDSAVFMLDLKSISRGSVEIKDLLYNYKDCVLYNNWAGAFPYAENVIGLPKWY